MVILEAGQALSLASGCLSNFPKHSTAVNLNAQEQAEFMRLAAGNSRLAVADFPQPNGRNEGL